MYGFAMAVFKILNVLCNGLKMSHFLCFLCICGISKLFTGRREKAGEREALGDWIVVGGECAMQYCIVTPPFVYVDDNHGRCVEFLGGLMIFMGSQHGRGWWNTLCWSHALCLKE